MQNSQSNDSESTGILRRAVELKNQTIMKYTRNIFHAIMAFMAMGFAACTQDEGTAATSLCGQPINASFHVGGDDSRSSKLRANTLDEGDSWEDKDEIKVRIFTDYDPGSTAVLSYSGETETWSRSKNFRWLDEADKHTILAVYPSDKDFYMYNLLYDLPTDQSSEGKLKNADLITGYWHYWPSDYIKIPMQHRMSLVTIIYHVGTADYPNLDINSLKICSPHSGAAFDRSSNTDWTMDTSNYNETMVDACKSQDGEVKTFSAIIVPGTVETGKDFLTFSMGGKNFVANPKQSSERIFEAGKRYTYELKVGRDKVELTQIGTDAMTGWTTEEDL